MTGAPRWAYVSLDEVAAMGLPDPMAATLGPRTLPGLTYVVARQRWVKIGMTRDLATRLTQLRCPQPGVICPEGMDLAAPLTLMLTHPTNIEAALHRRFERYHVAGEWYYAAPVLEQLGVRP